ncbi:Putative tricarboxylic transport membrane protein OS=Bosea thiooxidans OX=53254 GN=ARD30_01390 PE=4 SV=1 [Bosea thiooxidans]
MTDNSHRHGANKPALIVGVLLLIVAALVGYDASQQTITSTYGVGPTAMPYVVATGLVVLGLAHFVVAFREGLPEPEEADSKALLWIAGGLIFLIACIAWQRLHHRHRCRLRLRRGMGRQALLVDAAIGFVLGLAIFLVFAKVLTLILPSGPLERLFL